MHTGPGSDPVVQMPLAPLILLGTSAVTQQLLQVLYSALWLQRCSSGCTCCAPLLSNLKLHLLQQMRLCRVCISRGAFRVGNIYRMGSSYLIVITATLAVGTILLQCR